MKQKALMLQTCNADMTSHKGFTWPESGPVICNDWNPTPCCGDGLYGLLWGEGNGNLLNWLPDAKWLVVEVAIKDIVNLGDKIKVPSGTVVFCGAKDDAIQYLIDHGGADKAIVGSTATAGDYGAATVGGRGTATAGLYGTATAGHWGAATAGHWGVATVGCGGIATVGDFGTAIARNHGTAKAGNGGIIIIQYIDDHTHQNRAKIGYIGEDGLKPNIAYHLNDDHEFEPEGEKIK